MKKSTVSAKKLEEVGWKAAKKAAKILVHYHKKQSFQIKHKGKVDLVTDADVESEAAVIKTIQKTFPDHAILAEESKDSHKESLEGPVWVIDPLDGTTNFSHGFPLFSVSIAYRENNQTQFGMIYQPILDELFVAHRGRGATLNGKKIQVSKINKLELALAATGFPYDRRESEQNNLPEFCAMELAAQCVRRPGAATLDLAYIACGRFDTYWESKLAAWDVAAGALLVEEAGGKVTDYSGKKFTNLWNREIVATNGRLHKKTLDLLSKARSK